MTGIDLSLEDKKFMQYLADNGWEGVVGTREDISLSEEAQETGPRTSSRERVVGNIDHMIQ